MKSVPLTAYPRTQVRRNRVKSVRKATRIPAVIYGRQAQPQNLEVAAKALEDLLEHSASEIVLVDLAVDTDPRPKRLALLQEVQHHPLSGHPLHVDFHEVAEDEKVTILVPVQATGEAVGVRTGGGTLEHVRFSLKVRALPKDLPEILAVDVSHLEVGQSVHIGEIPVPPGVELLGDKGIPVLTVAAPITEAQEQAAEEAAAAAPTQPEMIREKKEGAEGAAEGKPDKAAEKAPEKASDKGAEKKK